MWRGGLMCPPALWEEMLCGPLPPRGVYESDAGITEPGMCMAGRFPGSSTTTMHVNGWLVSFERVSVANSERTWMEGATTYWPWSCGPPDRIEPECSMGSSS